MKTKIALIIIGMLVLSVGVIYFTSPQKSMEHNGVKISTSAYELAKEKFKDQTGFIICNLESQGCLEFTKIKEGSK